MENDKHKENTVFRMLYVIGIYLVVTSHVGRGGILTDWFSENSFHMQLFFFASGYFYSSEAELNALSYIKRKVKHLLIPLILFNFIYGIFTFILSQFGFKIGESINLFNLFISSFVYGSAFSFNSPDWFIAQLFLVEIINVCIGTIIKTKNEKKEIVICMGYLVLGIISVLAVNYGNDRTSFVLTYRTLFCLSWYGIGRLYHLVLEKYDNIRNLKYFTIVFVIQFLLLMCNKDNVQGSVVRFYFPINAVSVYLSASMGIAFWLRICKLSSGYVMKNSFLLFLGKHTFTIVENQYLGFWIINTFLFLVHKNLHLIPEFEEELYLTKHNYFYIPGGNRCFLIVYVVTGVLFPLALSKIGILLKNHFAIGGKK